MFRPFRIRTAREIAEEIVEGLRSGEIVLDNSRETAGPLGFDDSRAPCAPPKQPAYGERRLLRVLSGLLQTWRDGLILHFTGYDRRLSLDLARALATGRSQHPGWEPQTGPDGIRLYRILQLSRRVPSQSCFPLLDRIEFDDEARLYRSRAGRRATHHQVKREVRALLETLDEKPDWE